MYIQLSKAGMEHLGIPAGPARLPLMPVSAEDKKELGRVMDRIGLSR
jgi:dihydrodipicolinate synthase/N-acetylneuraminate lyase